MATQGFFGFAILALVIVNVGFGLAGIKVEAFGEALAAVAGGAVGVILDRLLRRPPSH